MTPDEIAASIQLTERGRSLRTCTPRTAAQRLACAAAVPYLDAFRDRGAYVARVLRRYPSLLAWPIDQGTGEVRTVRLLSSINGFAKDDIATIQIPARHVEGTPRELAKTIAGLLA